MTAPRGIDWAWATRTGGNLDASQRRAMLAPLARIVLAYPGVRARLATGRRGPGAIDLDALTWPDSRLAREATEEAREVLSPHMYEHSVRTYLFGLLLAQLDRATVDEELVYVASILHDTHLEHPTPGRCFAVVGGERAERFARDRDVDPARAAAIGAAIGGHITPGAAFDVDVPEGFVSAGAFCDLTGVGLERMRASWVDEVHARHPRHDLRRHVLAAWRAEGEAVPGGRARWLTRVAGFPVLVRLAPYAE